MFKRDPWPSSISRKRDKVSFESNSGWTIVIVGAFKTSEVCEIDVDLKVDLGVKFGVKLGVIFGVKLGVAGAEKLPKK